MSFNYTAYRAQRRREGKDRPVRQAGRVTTEAAVDGQPPVPHRQIDPHDHSHPDSDVSRGETA